MKLTARFTLTAASLLMALIGCSGGSQSPTSAIPASAGAIAFHRIPAPDTAKSGIYVSAEFDTSILGFKTHYTHGRGPMCRIYTGLFAPWGIAADSSGNLIVPGQYNNNEKRYDSVSVYSGPGMCGTELGNFRDPFGPPVDAASLNAATGTIVLANQHDRGHNKPQIGGIVLCTLKSGCTKKLTSPNITGWAFGVAVAKNGDCWLTSENATFSAAAMTYWRGCTGSGEAATGFMNTFYGSLSIDKNGNLLSVDAIGGAGRGGQLWVYSGCNPGCTVVGGPFPLQGNPLSGALNAKGDTFGVLETSYVILGGHVDIYKYAPTSLTYEYSFDTSLAPVDNPYGFAYSPALQQ